MQIGTTSDVVANGPFFRTKKRRCQNYGLGFGRKQLPERSLAGSQAPAWPFFGKQELQKPRSQAGAWERAKIPSTSCSTTRIGKCFLELIFQSVGL